MLGDSDGPLGGSKGILGCIQACFMGHVSTPYSTSALVCGSCSRVIIESMPIAIRIIGHNVNVCTLFQCLSVIGDKASVSLRGRHGASRTVLAAGTTAFSSASITIPTVPRRLSWAVAPCISPCLSSFARDFLLYRVSLYTSPGCSQIPSEYDI